MGDFILISGDKVIFNPAFPPAIVVVQPGTLAGTGRGRVNGKPVCVFGDEKNVIVPGCAYTSGAYTVPGVGILTIASLAGTQIAKRDNSRGKPVLLKSAVFTAKFQVLTPATMPPPPATPDPLPQYTGTGSFITTNLRVKGA